MNCTAAEKDLKKRFEGIYERGQLPVIKDIERRVFGSDYGANSWTTRAEADDICQLLELRSGHRLLDVGAGSGWPAGGPEQSLAAPDRGCALRPQWGTGVGGSANPSYRRHRWVLSCRG